MWGMTAWATWSGPNRLTSTSRRQSSRSTRRKVLNTSAAKTLFTRTSTPPSRSTVVATRRSHCSLSVTSVGTTRARPPLDCTSAAMSSSTLWRRAASTTAHRGRPPPAPPAGRAPVPLRTPRTRALRAAPRPPPRRRRRRRAFLDGRVATACRRGEPRARGRWEGLSAGPGPLEPREAQMLGHFPLQISTAREDACRYLRSIQGRGPAMTFATGARLGRRPTGPSPPARDGARARPDLQQG